MAVPFLEQRKDTFFFVWLYKKISYQKLQYLFTFKVINGFRNRGNMIVFKQSSHQVNFRFLKITKPALGNWRYAWNEINSKLKTSREYSGGSNISQRNASAVSFTSFTACGGTLTIWKTTLSYHSTYSGRFPFDDLFTVN